MSIPTFRVYDVIVYMRAHVKYIIYLYIHKLYWCVVCVCAVYTPCPKINEREREGVREGETGRER